MSRHRLGRIIVLLVALGLALTACSPTSAPTSSKRSPLSSPTVRIPLKCSQLFSVEAARGLVGYPVSVKADETTVPVDIYAIAARQAGTLSCVWGGGGLADETLGYNEQLEVDVAADASAAYSTNVAAIYAGTSPTLNTAGDKSESLCTGSYCGAEMLVGTYWVSVELQNYVNSAISPHVASTRLQHVLTTVATALRGAKPAPAWKPPASQFPTVCSSTQSRATLQKILGMTGLKPTPAVKGPVNAYLLAFSGTGTAWCQWRDDHARETEIARFDEVDFGIVKGGAWSLAALVRSPQKIDDLGTYRAVKIPGTSAAVLACSSISSCTAILAIDNNVIEVDLQVLPTVDEKGPSMKRTIATLSQLVHAITPAA